MHTNSYGFTAEKGKSKVVLVQRRFVDKKRGPEAILWPSRETWW